MASRGISDAARRAQAYVDDARDAATGIGEVDLRAGLTRLVAELLSDLPG